jgi:hypothetical protein
MLNMQAYENKRHSSVTTNREAMEELPLDTAHVILKFNLQLIVSFIRTC